jgi:hypothetical protein
LIFLAIFRPPSYRYERFALKHNSTGSDAIVRIGDAISRILSRRHGDAVWRIGVAQLRIGVALTAKSDTAQGDHTPVDVPYENVYTIGYIPFKVIEKGVAHGGVVIVGIHPEPYAIWRQLGHFIVAVRCLGDNLVGC